MPLLQQLPRAIFRRALDLLGERGDGGDEFVHLVRRGADEAFALRKNLLQLFLRQADAPVAGEESAQAASPLTRARQLSA